MPAASPHATVKDFPIEWPVVERIGSRRSAAIRRPTQQQGRALELLGHAVEYLIDSRMQPDSLPSDELAVQTLMRLNREVFAECAQIVPLRRRLRRWLRW